MSAATPHTGLYRVAHIMGMPIIVDVRDPAVDPRAVDSALDWLRWVDVTFSTYKPESEICRLNRGELRLVEAHTEVRAVLRRCDELYDETGGYFDIAAPFASAGPAGPAAVDPSGYVKGWAVDRAGMLLEEAGARNYALYAGGDIRVRGYPSPGSPWRIGIQHPFLRDKIAATVAAYNLAIATSGAYARGAHILDPHTGAPPRDVLSVTVVGPDLGTADAYATAAYAMGRNGPHWTARLGGYDAMTILADETVLLTPAFPTA